MQLLTGKQFHFWNPDAVPNIDQNKQPWHGLAEEYRNAAISYFIALESDSAIGAADKAGLAASRARLFTVLAKLMTGETNTGCQMCGKATPLKLFLTSKNLGMAGFLRIPAYYANVQEKKSPLYHEGEIAVSMPNANDVGVAFQACVKSTGGKGSAPSGTSRQSVAGDATSVTGDGLRRPVAGSYDKLPFARTTGGSWSARNFFLECDVAVNDSTGKGVWAAWHTKKAYSGMGYIEQIYESPPSVDGKPQFTCVKNKKASGRTCKALRLRFGTRAGKKTLTAGFLKLFPTTNGIRGTAVVGLLQDVDNMATSCASMPGLQTFKNAIVQAANDRTSGQQKPHSPPS